MNKKIFQLKKIQAGVFLAGILLVNTNTIFAINTSIQINSYSSELPRPQYQNEYGTFLVDATNSKISVSEFYNQLNDYFGLDNQHTFELVNEQRDANTGYSSYSYQHFYNDVKVNGDMVFVHAKNDKVQYINGQIIKIADLSVIHSIDEAKIKEVALNNFGAADNVQVGTIENFIYKQESNEGKILLKQVAKINLTATKPFKTVEYLIDVQSNEILSQLDKLHKADAQSTSATYFRGNQSITVDSYNGSYRLKDNTRNIRTLNAVNLDGYLNADGTFSGYTEYTNSSANFTATSTKPAVEVHWAMKNTYDYYKNIHSRTSFDGNGHVINNYYDAGAMLGTNENAAALDEVNNGYELIGMFYGKGGSYIHPVVSLDVAGHEFSHMVVSRNGNGGLDYQNESGALNESFADMFGTAIEFYVNDNPNWTMGEGLMKSNSITPNYFRSMSNPNSAPTMIGMPSQPDTYKGTYWQNTTSNPNNNNDQGGVHTNSGVGNHWFYLLSEGGSGVNDINKSYNVTGITIQKAEKIAYKALTTGLSSSATYLDAYNATIAAAATLYGANSNEWKQVVNAWYAVGIGNGAASTKNYEMEAKLKVYPNPVTGDEVTIESDLPETTTVEMFDMTGKQILAPKQMENRTILNTSSYKAGVYILKFKSTLGEYSHKLIVK
ncbi:M4 family metallopeptidase [Flavobacterium dauae]|uniref:M4 family metallopeptidase n=1 Tax=Flavobacterium dauae TaxID=1563479 RepID=UPI00101B30A7|nr:M4 family metallopeptidase [Flavobacterium dauae]WLD25024.1 M4 family metallopeptidase [Flavobacterium dauae]